MTTVSQNAFKQLFNDPNYAWELLEWEIAIEMNDALSGQAIAKLLELYMRGVEKMNSIMDVRQSYFKNKVTSLMTKNTVVKTLTKPPMAKKEKPLEVTAYVDPKPQVKPIQKKKKQQAPVIKGSKPDQKSVQPINSFVLQQKKKQIQMRLAYQAQESTRQNLNKMLNQHQKKQESFQDKVKGIMNSHEQRLKERINRRKLKTATYRSRPEDTNDTSSKQMDLQIIQEKKQMEQSFGNGKSKIQRELNRKRFKSLQNRVAHELTLQESPKRSRKSTLDMTSEGMQPLQILRIKSEEVKSKMKQHE